MVSTFTTNKSFEKPARGDYVGTWDTPVNGNMNLADSALGGLATIALTNSPVTLSSGQYSNVFIRLTGALTGNVPITLPAIGSFYTVINDTTNSSAFYVTMTTTAAGGQVIGVPIGAVSEIMTDGTNVKLRHLPHVGAYWDYAGSSMPAWVTACTIWPYLNCDGTAFSSAIYPNLAVLLGSATLPDSRGRYRAALNQGTGRINSGSSTGGVDGNTLAAVGGAETVTLSSANIPSYALPVTDPGHTHTVYSGNVSKQAGGDVASLLLAASGGDNKTTSSATTGVTVNSGGGGQNFSNIPPTYMGGLTLIRAG